MSEETKQPTVTDEMYITKWRAMLKIFKDTIETNPAIKDVKDDLLELKGEAVNTFLLTPAQKRGIVERVDNYLNGSYGRNLSKISN
jgi:phosphoglycolate phosphatase-like HAD superfamily hydrolase